MIQLEIPDEAVLDVLAALEFVAKSRDFRVLCGEDAQRHVDRLARELHAARHRSIKPVTTSDSTAAHVAIGRAICPETGIELERGTPIVLDPLAPPPKRY